MHTEWSNPQRVDDYLFREIPHRDIAERLLLEALPDRVTSFLDLGTGAGRLAALVHERYPHARAIGTDLSEPMLARARKQFEGRETVRLIEHDMAEPLASIDGLSELGPLDAVVSALAIHHLEDAPERLRRRELSLPPALSHRLYALGPGPYPGRAVGAR